jgi:hypothetical protein
VRQRASGLSGEQSGQGAGDQLDDQGEPIYDWLSWDTPRVSKWRENNYHKIDSAKLVVTKEELQKFWHQDRNMGGGLLWRMEMWLRKA